jgi:hypothetical protein
MMVAPSGRARRTAGSSFHRDRVGTAGAAQEVPLDPASEERRRESLDAGYRSV